MAINRRQFILATGAAFPLGMAGCLDSEEDAEQEDTDDTEDDADDTGDDTSDDDIPDEFEFPEGQVTYTTEKLDEDNWEVVIEVVDMYTSEVIYATTHRQYDESIADVGEDVDYVDSIENSAEDRIDDTVPELISKTALLEVGDTLTITGVKGEEEIEVWAFNEDATNLTDFQIRTIEVPEEELDSPQN